MKISEKQKVLLANVLEGILFIGGIAFGLSILVIGFTMIWHILKSLFV
jgi:hypothetical protein